MLLIALALLADQPASAGTRKIDEDDRVKCKTELVTGTLAGRRRICHTVKEWRQITDASYAKAKEIQEMGLISPSHGN